MNHNIATLDFAWIESELANASPFGDAQHINTLNDRRCLKRLFQVADLFPIVTELMNGLDQLDVQRCHEFLRDPVFRIGIDQALLLAKEISTPTTREWTEQLLDQAAALLRSQVNLAMLQEGQSATAAKLGAHPFDPMVWQGEGIGLVPQCIESLVCRLVSESQVDNPSDAQINVLKEAVRLLDRLLPVLTPSVLNHVVLIVIVSDRDAVSGSGHSGFQSGTSSALPGVIMLSASELSTPWRAAESILHEGLHLKFIDLEFTLSMGLKHDNAAQSWIIRPPWKEFEDAKDGWPPIRTMTAAHVYTGLALLFNGGQLLASQADAAIEYPIDEFESAAVSASARAKFLINTLDERIDSIGLAGQYFIRWLKGLVVGSDREWV